MADHDDNLILVVRQVFAASAEFLFDAWTEPALMAKWFHAGANWTTEIRKADVRVGGAWELDMRREDGSVCRAWGKYLVIERPHRLVFTWHVDGEVPYETTVTLTFKALDRHTTELVLTQTGLRNEPDRAEHRHGWSGCLSNLELLCNERKA
jgi:uncharacterized protein YndB with AHSA1/START domain